MTNNELKIKNGVRYLIGYQLNWNPAFNLKDMPQELIAGIENAIRNVCVKYQYDVMELRISEDDVMVKISCPYTVAPVDAMKMLKSLSTMALIHEYPQIHNFYVKSGMVWKHGCAIRTFAVSATN